MWRLADSISIEPLCRCTERSFLAEMPCVTLDCRSDSQPSFTVAVFIVHCSLKPARGSYGYSPIGSVKERAQVQLRLTDVASAPSQVNSLHKIQQPQTVSLWDLTHMFIRHSAKLV